MKERPILFSGPLVRALLEGRKTQTRRLLKSEPPARGDGQIVRVRHGDQRGSFVYLDFDGVPGLSWRPYGGAPTQPFPDVQRCCPYGLPGDRLWVKETFGPCAGGVVYRANDIGGSVSCPDGGRWKPSIFMPRWASRLSLEVTSNRLERLQDITEDDAKAEGVTTERQQGKMNGEPATLYPFTHRQAFIWLWDAINGKKAPWASNPWVWVVCFKVIKGGRA